MKNGRGRADLRRHNVSAVLRRLLDHGPAARVDLASSLSLSTAAVTRIAGELLAAGVVRELEPVPSSDAGRRRVPIDLSADRFVAAAVNIGLERMNFGLVGLRGGLVAPFRPVFHTRLDPEAVMTEAVEAVRGAIAALPDGVRVLGTGFSVAGTVDAERGIVQRHSALPWRDVPVAELAGDRFPGPLVVDSTFRTLARAEMWFGAARNVASLVHLPLGNVIGAGLVFDGRLHDGALPGAGGVAHFPVSTPAARPCSCGRRGCLVSVAGVPAILDKATAEGLDATSWSDLERLAAGGDGDGSDIARRLLDERIIAIGEVVAALVDLLAPERVVVVGVGVGTPAQIASLRAAVADWSASAVDVDRVVVPSGLAEAPAVVSSATPILDRFYDDPFAFVARPTDAIAVGG